jgi:hypothetical protein
MLLVFFVVQIRPSFLASSRLCVSILLCLWRFNDQFMLIGSV